MQQIEFTLEVWGDLACFTRPELKVERFSYPVITPSAARAIFEAVYWNPQLRWQVTRVEILEQPRYIALRRNEVKGRAPSERTIRQWMSGKKKPEPLWADGEEEGIGRTQRQTMALKKVRYRLHARIEPWEGYQSELVKFQEQFRRRVKRGQCIYQPYFGCREFPAYFTLVEEGDETQPVNYSADLGFMLYDVFDLSKPGTNMSPPAVSLFEAKVVNGVLEVPEYSSAAVLKPGEEVDDA